MSVHFQVDDQAAPRLAGDGEPAPELEGLPNQPESDIVVEQWSPEEAQGVMQTMMNFGVFFYGRDWLCGPEDFRRSSANMARLLERVFPKASSGGPIGLGIDVAAVASDFGVAIADRRHLLKKGPKKGSEIAKEFGLGAQPQPVAPEEYAPAPPPAQPVAAGDSQPQESSAFRFSPEVAAALGQASGQNVDLGPTGMGF